MNMMIGEEVDLKGISSSLRGDLWKCFNNSDVWLGFDDLRESNGFYSIGAFGIILNNELVLLRNNGANDDL